VRPLNPPVGVVKSLVLIGSGPVGLLHTQKVRIKYKKPTNTSARQAEFVLGRFKQGLAGA
jgi:hypothetical protein